MQFDIIKTYFLLLSGIKMTSKTTTRLVSFLTLIVLGVLIPISSGEAPVLILSENSKQILTSTTLEWVAANRQTSSFENAVVGGLIYTKGQFQNFYSTRECAFGFFPFENWECVAVVSGKPFLKTPMSETNVT